MTVDQVLDTRDVCCDSKILTDLRQPQPILSVGNSLLIFVMSRSRLVLDQPLLGSSSRQLRELHVFPTRNAFITTQYSL